MPEEHGSLLNMLGLAEHNISKYNGISQIEKAIDYSVVKKIIASKQQESFSYLKKVLSCKTFTHNI